MEQHKGKPISPTIAVGKIWFYSPARQSIPRYQIENYEAEINRYEQAKEKTIASLKESYNKALVEIGEMGASIFEAHQMILMDEEYNQKICNAVYQDKINVEAAIVQTQEYFSKIFATMEDELFKEREADIRDVSKRLLAALLSDGEKPELIPEPSIVVAKDLTPGETIQMDKNKILGFVTELGSANSHTAILARTMNLPALMGVPVKEEWNGKMAALDGETGILYIAPEASVIDKLKKRQSEKKLQKSLLEQMKGQETCTKAGKRILLYANVGNVSDVKQALDNDAEGIGLFRSEFLYLGRDSFPTEEEQFEQYKTATQMAGNHRLVIRTLDIGAD